MNDGAKFWDGIAEKYANMPIRDEAGYQATLDRVRKHLKPGDHVLELGCGTGSTAVLLAPEVGHCTAADYAVAMVEIGKGKAQEGGVENVTFLQADPFDARFEAGAYDVVMGMNFYHLLPDMAAGFRRSAELLKPGGLVIAKTPSFGSAPFFKRTLIRIVIRAMQLLGRAPPVKFVRVEDVEKAVREAGFEIIEAEVSGGGVPRSFVIARKG